MLALEILNKYRNLCSGIYLGDDYSDGVDSYSKDIEECDEAIKELEALENRSCEGCKYVYIDTLGFNYCENPISPLSSCIFALHPSFCCNKWKSKC